ncbi:MULTISPECIES: hypothetical protein [unclassified Leptolyngbya]|uniref:hypothetical protein n=1 Tax=unclassified Leptolyngbya TaxID=2650499 RepID=UPI00168A2FC7|nr:MULTISPECIES: hypothetical protein [unclassified Leptolyngbya]MBD1909891.1 hypothetical protein [Leptolyngbya sp. FACHB-8]MBD2158645.1 hypothetical protein [Leptolyngbya sp. FACHB-16]
MKVLKVLLIALLCFVNLLVVRPALADRPPLTENPDYVEITNALTNLLQAKETNTLPKGITLADADQKITTLQYQKYIMETGKDTICRNDTTQPVAVYGTPGKKSTSQFEQVLYLLPAGEETDDDWACSGLYVPNDAKVDGLDAGRAAAVKVLSGTQLVLNENPDTGVIELNVPPAGVFKAGDVNWEIPDLAQADLATIPAAPLD